MESSRLDVQAALEPLARTRREAWKLTACGVTRSERQILALVDRDAYSSESDRVRVLLVGGLSGRLEDVALALEALRRFDRHGEIALSAVPCCNPDGLALGAAPGNGAGGNPARGYPPQGGYFNDPKDPESRYLWRWTCFQAPDLVLEVRAGPSVRWEANGAAQGIGAALGAASAGPADSLVSALGQGRPGGLGTIPALRLTAPEASLGAELERLWSLLRQSPPGPSEARRELDRRRARSPLEVARTLASVYGHGLDPVIYTQGVAVSGRVRLARMDPASAAHVQQVAELVEPYVSGAKPAFKESPTTPDLAGVVWADEMAEVTGDRRYADILLKAASFYQDRGKGAAPPPSDADFRTEDMFMNGAVLGRAFKLTGDNRYLQLLTRSILDTGIQQPDGLFWHCRSAPYYWGRGNGFALMGLTETLTCLPDDYHDRDAILSMYRRQVEGLLRLQQPSGMFLQVLDFPGSYQELTATCMTGYSIARGIRMGWLDSAYVGPLRLMWQGASERVDESGNIVDGCTGTGVQKSLRDYLDRAALSGYDDRTGSMALWFAVEIVHSLQLSVLSKNL